MNILATSYTLQYKSLDIYVAGCNGKPSHCINCHNPQSWNFNQGEIYNKIYFSTLKRKSEEFDSMIENIMIFGGEPNDQNEDDLYELLLDLSSLGKPIWLFTRYELNEIPSFELYLCDYIKCGRYEDNLRVDDNIQYGIKLSTSNQKIYKKGLDY